MMCCLIANAFSTISPTPSGPENLPWRCTSLRAWGQSKLTPHLELPTTCLLLSHSFKTNCCFQRRHGHTARCLETRHHHFSKGMVQLLSSFIQPQHFNFVLCCVLKKWLWITKHQIESLNVKWNVNKVKKINFDRIFIFMKQQTANTVYSFYLIFWVCYF